MAHFLDNPIWSALSTEQQPLALSHGSARRYPADVSPLAGLLEPTAEAFSDLRALVTPGERVALFTAATLDVPGDWETARAMWIDQMVYQGTPAAAENSFLTMGKADVAEMLALTAATQPGPFLPRTIEMGRYFGVRSDDGRLAAMAGERLRSNTFTEVSAVCTDPEFRGRGYALALVTFLATQIAAAGKTAFLHVKSDNGAKAVYEKAGFRRRSSIRLTVISPAGGTG